MIALQVNPLIQFAVAIRIILGPWAYPPLSAITVLLVSTIMALTTNLVNRRFIDYEKMRRARTEIQKWQAMKRKVTEATDPRIKRKLELKVKRRERYIMKLQSEVGRQSMLPMLVTIIPFMLVYAIMNGIFINDWLFPGNPIPGVVLFSPLDFGTILGPFGLGFGWHGPPFDSYPGIPPGGQGLFYIFWYILCSFTVNLLIQKILGTSMTV